MGKEWKKANFLKLVKILQRLRKTTRKLASRLLRVRARRRAMVTSSKGGGAGFIVQHVCTNSSVLLRAQLCIQAVHGNHCVQVWATNVLSQFYVALLNQQAIVFHNNIISF